MANPAQTATTCAVPRPRWRSWGWLLVAAVVTLLAVARATAIAEPDVLWQARTGLGILGGVLPRHDTFSWTVPGKAWVPNSWAFDALLGLGWKAGGYAGLGAAATTLVAALGATVTARARRLGAHPVAVAAVVLVGFEVMFGWLQARPQMAGYILCPLVVWCARPALAATGRRRVAWVAALAGLHLLWVNLHFSALTGPACLAAAAVTIEGRRLWLGRPDTMSSWVAASSRAVLRCTVVVVPSALACLVTPYGPAAVVKAVVVRDASVGLISEWGPVGFATDAQGTGLALLVLSLPAVWFAWRAGRVEVAAALGALAVMSVDACRFAPLMACVALPELAVAASGPAVRAWATSRRWALFACVAVLVAPVTVAFGGAVTHPGRPAPEVFDVALVRAIPSGCRVVNDYRSGGLIILERPDVRVSLDGRNDLYGRQMVLRAAGWLDDAPGTRAALADGRVGCVLGPRTSALVRRLSTDSGWSVTASSGQRELLVRR